MINGNKKHGQLLATARGTKKKNRLPNKRESGKARNRRSASAKWGGNRGESSAHLRVKWTVDNINTLLPLLERRAREENFERYFLLPRVSHRRSPLPAAPSPALFSSVSFLPPFLRTIPHRERILREEFSATRSRWYPEGNLLTRSKFSSRKSFEKSHPEFKGKPFI